MSKTSIVLCGFMSCGKSTLGTMIAKRLGYDMVDTDQLLFHDTGMTLQEMFKIGGEAYFRDLEHETIKKAAGMTRTIISTGGGVMTFERNARLLKENALIVHIHRPFEDCYRDILKRKNRPIAGQKSEAEMREMYDRRVPLYNLYADYILENKGSAEAGVRELMCWIQAGAGQRE